jgi:hypothetical protein
LRNPAGPPDGNELNRQMRLCLTAAYRDFSKRFDPIYHAARLTAKHVKARIRSAFDPQRQCARCHRSISVNDISSPRANRNTACK